MRRFLVTGSCLVAVTSAGSAGAVDVTLGGHIDLGIEFGLGKDANRYEVREAYNDVSLYFQAGGTTDRGIQYAANVTALPLRELRFNAYTSGTGKHLIKATNKHPTVLEAAVRSVSGGAALSADKIVAVKINSEWRSVKGTETRYTLPVDSLLSSNICKVAGAAFQAPTLGTYAGRFIDVQRQTPQGGAVNAAFSIAEAATPAYLPAGRLIGAFTNFQRNSAPVGTGASTVLAATITPTLPNFLSLTAQSPNGGKINVSFFVDEAVVATQQVTGPLATSSTSVTVTAKQPRGTVGYIDLAPTSGGQNVNVEVSNAAIYAGPFMEVKLASSTTRMVVGAACLEGSRDSSTDYYMQNNQQVLSMGQASVFVEGGFGRAILQTNNYGGTVTAVGGAGDEANLSANGLVAILEGQGPMGIKPYLAIDLAKDDTLTSIELLTGGTYYFGGLTASLDVRLNTADFDLIEDWDLGLRYALGRLDLMAALDSRNDWGLTASIDIEQFQVDLEIASVGRGDHSKDGIYYAFQASTSFGGLSLEAGMDLDHHPTVALNYPLGEAIIYASYLGSTQSGAFGVQLDF